MNPEIISFENIYIYIYVCVGKQKYKLYIWLVEYWKLT